MLSSVCSAVASCSDPYGAHNATTRRTPQCVCVCVRASAALPCRLPGPHSSFVTHGWLVRWCPSLLPHPMRFHYSAVYAENTWPRSDKTADSVHKPLITASIRDSPRQWGLGLRIGCRVYVEPSPFQPFCRCDYCGGT